MIKKETFILKLGGYTSLALPVTAFVSSQDKHKAYPNIPANANWIIVTLIPSHYTLP